MSQGLVAIQAGFPRVSQGATRRTLERVHGALPADRVTLGWLHRELEAQATYLLVFLLALVGALPGASLPAGLAICALAIRMMLSWGETALPATLASREIATGHARYALTRAIALLRLCERVLPAARTEDLANFRPFAGALLFVLGAMLLVPIPLSNVLPALAAAAVALALAEGSFVLFAVSSATALGAFALMAITVSAATSFI